MIKAERSIGYGGGLYNGGSVVADNSTFSNNEANETR